MTAPRVCLNPACEATLTPHDGEPPRVFCQRRYCSTSCKRHQEHVKRTQRSADKVAQQRRKVDARIEDTEWLVLAGELPERIAARIEGGRFTVAALAKSLGRHGRKDLETYLSRAHLVPLSSGDALLAA